MKRALRVAAVLAIAALACRSQPSTASPGGEEPVPTDPAARDYPAPPLPRTHVVVEDAFGGKRVVDVEVCLTPEMRARGMMWRTELADGKGMLFVFPDEEWRSFWMKNTLIPLDIIFIDAQQRIVGIVENARPQTTTSRAVEDESKYVLEVPGGWSAKIGLQSGSRVSIEGVDRFQPE